jgi:hypothetical protein
MVNSLIQISDVKLAVLPVEHADQQTPASLALLQDLLLILKAFAHQTAVMVSY